MKDNLDILVIEDHADTANSLAAILQLAGHAVQTARDGPAGLDAARARWPDVVLLDLGLPGSLDGYEVAQWFREQTGRRRAVIIAVTGFDRPDERKRSYETGIDFHFTKPADPVVLADILNRLQHLNQTPN